MRSLLLQPILYTALAQAAGTFNVATFNVAGLPPIFNGNEIPGDKNTNTARIGQLFNQYNFSVINMQEDFNFHATLYANDKHPFRTPTSGGVPFGSGLNTVSNFDFTNFQRVKWNVCSNTESADCLTPKGFTFMRVRVASGVTIDMYNLHADAGTSAADLKARAANLRQVSDYIKTDSVGNAVIVFGDSNTRYTRGPDDIPGIFGTENGMKDVWVELIRNGVPPAGGSATLGCDNPSRINTCETVDKVWYRSSPAVNLQATSFDYVGDMFLQPDGSILSDHNPVLVDFAWTIPQKLSVSDTFGGEFGDWYNDLATIGNLSPGSVATVTLRGQNRLDAIGVTWKSGQTFRHGGNGGNEVSLTLQDGELLVAATLIFYAELRTSKGRSLKSGTMTSDCVEQSAPQGSGIVGFLGRGGDEVDMVGFVYGSA
ncbi:Endonuclease/exonuclease/phosphatase [Phaeosphaeriaceae sp. PMI808]|nr:Endonuclease/exonuclease/phosphatase [Phaeosphaeriaceae sp. PMI808]